MKDVSGNCAINFFKINIWNRVSHSDNLDYVINLMRGSSLKIN